MIELEKAHRYREDECPEQNSEDLKSPCKADAKTQNIP